MQSDALTLLTAILPSEGWYCGWRKDTKQHYWTRSLEELAEWCLAIGKHTDVYHGCCSFKEPTRRIKDNVQAIKALRLDIDAGEGKPYGDSQTAILAVGRFAAEHSLPRPFVVGSGGGLHIYFPLRDAINGETFLLLANQLRNLCHDGLFIDEGCTMDPVRILRTPGTFNYKDAANPRPVKLLCTGGLYTPERLGLTPGAAASPVPPRRSSGAAGGLSLTDRLASYDDAPTADAEAIADRCFAIEAFAADKDIDNPLWFAGMSVLARCVNGEEKAREWSAEHRRDRVEDVFARSEGPSTCEHFHTVAGLCEGCPHRGQIKSPIQLGRVAAQPPGPFPQAQGKPWDELPPPPYPFSWGANGELMWLAEGKGGKEVNLMVSRFPVYIVSENEGEKHDKGQAVVLRSWRPHDGWKEIEISAKTLFGAQGMAELEGQGVTVHNRDKMGEFLRKSRDQIAAGRKVDTRFEQFGWKFSSKGFVIGRTLWLPEGERSSKAVPIIGTADFNKRAADAFVTKGDRDTWRRAVANFTGPGKEAHAYMLAAPFAAPFMQFFCSVSEGGVIVHGWSPDTGAGKSTSMFGGMAGIGNPEFLKISSIDTINSRADLFALFHTLPVCFDEVDKIDPEAFHAAVMQFTQGQGKAAMTQGGTRVQRNGRWSTMLLMTANFSLMHALAARGGSIAQMHRVVELRFPDEKLPSSMLYKTFDDHYGWGAVEFFPYIVRPYVNQWLREHELPRVADKLRKEYDLGAAADRFQLYAHAGVWVACEIAKTLGLFNLTPQRVIEGALKSRETLKQIQGDRLTMLDLLGMLMQENAGTVVTVPHEVKAGVKQRPQTVHFQRLNGRWEANTRTLYFSWTRILEFLQKQGVATNEFYKTLVKQGIIASAAPRRMDITRDIHDMNSCSINVVQFDMGSPLITNQPRLAPTQQEERDDGQPALLGE